jgi:hypothetical protein
MGRIRLLQDSRASATGFAMAETYAGESGGRVSGCPIFGTRRRARSSRLPISPLGNLISPTEGG